MTLDSLVSSIRTKLGRLPSQESTSTRRSLGGCNRAIKLILLLLICAVPAMADSVCIAGNYSSMVGTTCSIGSLTFTFNGTSSLGGGWTASSLYFIPAINGFTLDFLGGPQSISANFPGPPFSGASFDELGLNFNVVAPNGYYFNGDSVSTSASFEASGIFSAAFPGVIAKMPKGSGGAGIWMSKYAGHSNSPFVKPYPRTTRRALPFRRTHLSMSLSSMCGPVAEARIGMGRPFLLLFARQ